MKTMTMPLKRPGEALVPSSEEHCGPSDPAQPAKRTEKRAAAEQEHDEEGEVLADLAAASSPRPHPLLSLHLPELSSASSSAPSSSASSSSPHPPPPQHPIEVLILGDGNLSYAAALARHILPMSPPRIRLIATTFPTEDKLADLHPSSVAHAAELRSMGATVLGGIDATRLALHFPERTFHRIVWNFPQHPDHRKIQRHRELLRAFFQACGPQVASGGEVWVTLKAGQGGSPAELPVHRRDFKNSWQIQEQVRIRDCPCQSFN